MAISNLCNAIGGDLQFAPRQHSVNKNKSIGRCVGQNFFDLRVGKLVLEGDHGSKKDVQKTVHCRAWRIFVIRQSVFAPERMVKSGSRLESDAVAGTSRDKPGDLGGRRNLFRSHAARPNFGKHVVALFGIGKAADLFLGIRTMRGFKKGIDSYGQASSVWCMILTVGVLTSIASTTARPPLARCFSFKDSMAAIAVSKAEVFDTSV